MTTTKVILENGKYEVSHDNGTNFHARRFGEKWRDLSGDGLIFALVSRVEQLEKLFNEPTQEMVQAGLAEVQRMLDEWDEEGHLALGAYNDPVSDDQASDLAVFVLQAMAGKLPKGA